MRLLCDLTIEAAFKVEKTSCLLCLQLYSMQMTVSHFGAKVSNSNFDLSLDDEKTGFREESDAGNVADDANCRLHSYLQCLFFSKTVYLVLLSLILLFRHLPLQRIIKT